MNFWKLYRLSGYTYRILLTVTFHALLVTGGFGQSQLAFTGTPTRSGTAGAVNTTYTYDSVGSSGTFPIKAVIQITAIAGGATLNNIDGTSGGSANAWQPLVNGPNTSNGNCWGMTFRVSFYNGQTNDPVVLSSFAANGIDIDGNGSTLREYNEPYGLSNYTVENPTSLTVTQVAGGYNFRSPQTEYSGISLNQTNVAATWQYQNASSMSIKIGACCEGGSCSATGSNRQYSINFYDAVTYSTGNTVLPVNFLSVTARSSGNKNIIDWKVSGESNLMKYVIEKSNSENAGFSELGTIAAAAGSSGDHEYSFTDHSGGAAFYRIRGVDADGKGGISPVVKLSGRTQLRSLRVLNQTNGNHIAYEMQSEVNMPMTLRLADQNGRLISQESVRIKKGTNQYLVDPQTVLRRGIYILHLTASDGGVYYSKFIR